jgi:hypothetical protein
VCQNREPPGFVDHTITGSELGPEEFALAVATQSFAEGHDRSAADRSFVVTNFSYHALAPPVGFFEVASTGRPTPPDDVDRRDPTTAQKRFEAHEIAETSTFRSRRKRQALRPAVGWDEINTRSW